MFQLLTIIGSQIRTPVLICSIISPNHDYLSQSGLSLPNRIISPKQDYLSQTRLSPQNTIISPKHDYLSQTRLSLPDKLVIWLNVATNVKQDCVAKKTKGLNLGICCRQKTCRKNILQIKLCEK